jgi:hypothetical protein
VAVLDQAITILSGIAGGVIGHFAGGRRMLWTTAGALAGAVIVPPIAGLVLAQAAPQLAGQTFNADLAPGRTIILRASVGDTIIVKAPSTWGVPASSANIPGFLTVQASDTEAETTTLLVTEAGQGQVQMVSGGETATLSVEAT